MKNHFACPHCSTTLNPNVKIILAVNHRRRRGLILLSPQPGNYKIIGGPDVDGMIKAGDSVKFHCPVCAVDLTSKEHRQFAELQLNKADHAPQRILFSRKFGTHATFIVDGDHVLAYGDDNNLYDQRNFFGE